MLYAAPSVNQPAYTALIYGIRRSQDSSLMVSLSEIPSLWSYSTKDKVSPIPILILSPPISSPA